MQWGLAPARLQAPAPAQPQSQAQSQAQAAVPVPVVPSQLQTPAPALTQAQPQRVPRRSWLPVGRVNTGQRVIHHHTVLLIDERQHDWSPVHSTMT